MASDPLVRKILLRLHRLDPLAARRADAALDAVLGPGGLADLTQHDLQTYLWFTLPDTDEPQPIAAALARFLELAEMDRYAGVAASTQTAEILRTYEERGRAAGAKAASRAMDACGILPPDLPELEWGEIMGDEEVSAYERVAATLELALAAGELRPGSRGWRAAQARLSRQQLTMPRTDGPSLLQRIRTERLELWAESGGPSRRSLASSMVGDLATEPPLPPEVAVVVAPVQWLLALAAGPGDDSPGIALTVSGNLSRRVVLDAFERFGWRRTNDRLPRSESDLWQLMAIRAMLQRAGVLRRSGRRLVLTVRGRPLVDDPAVQWALITSQLIEDTEFDSAVQEAALMLLVGARGMVDGDELVREVADMMAGSGWRDTGSGAPPDDKDVRRAVWGLVHRCGLWSMVEESVDPARVRLTELGRRAAVTALRSLALRPRMDPDRSS